MASRGWPWPPGWLLLGCLVLLAAGPRCAARAGAWLVPGDVRLLVGASGISSVNTGQEFAAAMLDENVTTVALTGEAAGLVRCCQDPWGCRVVDKVPCFTADPGAGALRYA